MRRLKLKKRKLSKLKLLLKISKRRSYRKKIRLNKVVAVEAFWPL